MPELTPLDDNRQEHFLNGEDLEPITRREHFYAGRESELPAGHQEPETREEWFIQKYRGGGGDVTVVPLSVTDNGTYSEEGKAYSPVSVDVPLPQNAYLLKSVASLPQAIASFNDGEDMVMPSLKVAIEPQQEGSGDPSPENVRPISGWDEVDVTRTGKNLFDATNLINDRTIDTNGDLSGYGGRVATPNYIPVKPNTSICLSYSKTVSQNVVFIYALYKDGTLISRVANNPMGTAIQTENANQIRFAFYDSVSASDLYNIQLEYGNTATSYEPYNPNSETITIQLGDTYYGGKLDVVSGVLTVDRASVTVDENSNVISGSGGLPFRIDLLTEAKTSSSASALTGVKCNFLKEVTQSSSWGVDGTFSRVTTDAKIVYFKVNSEITTIQQLKTFLQSNNLQFVYELATPLTIQLTPTAVKSLLGSNNVWADTGDIKDAEYFSKEV